MSLFGKLFGGGSGNATTKDNPPARAKDSPPQAAARAPAQPPAPFTLVSAEVMAEGDVATANLTKLFEQAMFKTSLDKDGDLVVHTDGPRIIVMVVAGKKLLKFMCFYGFKASARQDAKLSFVNRLNDEFTFARFSVPSKNPNALVADYHMPFDGGIPAFLVVEAVRWLSRVVPGAIRVCNDQGLIE
jgi:hypothetical protein